MGKVPSELQGLAQMATQFGQNVTLLAPSSVLQALYVP